MKINLLIPNAQPLNTYNNVSLSDNLDKHVDDGECTELLAHGAIDYVEPSQSMAIIQGWVKKLAHGGQLAIIGTDLYEVSRLVTNMTMDIEKGNICLFGTGNKKLALTMNLISAYLQNLGLKIVKKKIEGINYIVVGERP